MRGSVGRWLVPRVVLPLVGRVVRRRMVGRLADLRERQWWSADRLEADAVTRLRRLIEHAGTHVPYYRRLFGDAGVRPEDIRSYADLSRIPVTTKVSLRDAGLEQTIADNLPASRRWPISTSGSTGVPAVPRARHGAAGRGLLHERVRAMTEPRATTTR